DAERMNRGVPPTALKARTGEFTPPGVTACARSKSVALSMGGRGGTQPLCPSDPTQSIRVEREMGDAPGSGAQQSGGLGGPVGQDHVGAGTTDRGQRLQD